MKKYRVYIILKSGKRFKGSTVFETFEEAEKIMLKNKEMGLNSVVEEMEYKNEKR